jgi:hypothetical protein
MEQSWPTFQVLFGFVLVEGSRIVDRALFRYWSTRSRLDTVISDEICISSASRMDLSKSFTEKISCCHQPEESADNRGRFSIKAIGSSNGKTASNWRERELVSYFFITADWKIAETRINISYSA